MEIGRKHFELMREVVPTASTIAFLLNPTNRTLAEPLTRDAQAAAHSLGLKLHVLHASTERDIENAFTTLAQLRADALVSCEMDRSQMTHSGQGCLDRHSQHPAINSIRPPGAGQSIWMKSALNGD